MLLPLSKKLLSLLAMIVFSACSGTTTDSGSPGGGGDAGSAGTGGTGGTAGTGGSGGSLPDDCAIEASHPGPYAVTFVFENHGSQDAYLLQECRLGYDVLSCADDYKLPKQIHADCTIDCSDNGGCIACGACMYEMLPISPGAIIEDSWAGNEYTFGTSSQGCSCHNQFVAPAGKYRIEVPVYDGAAPESAQVVMVAKADFTLPAPNDTVRVDVTPLYPQD